MQKLPFQSVILSLDEMTTPNSHTVTSCRITCVVLGDQICIYAVKRSYTYSSNYQGLVGEMAIKVLQWPPYSP
jgi:hypothetical protein